MKTLLPSPMKLVALILSIGISVSLMDAISAGFTYRQTLSQSVIELPMVTVHGKGLSSDIPLVADVNTNTASPVPASTQL